MIEVEDFLPEMKVFQKRRASWALPQRILVVRDGNALLRGQGVDAAACDLMQFPALSGRTRGFCVRPGCSAFRTVLFDTELGHGRPFRGWKSLRAITRPAWRCSKCKDRAALWPRGLLEKSACRRCSTAIGRPPH
jgi:hypothetical protein